MTNHPINPSTCILQLPNDCLYSIFQKLDSCSDRESFGLTCHRLLHIQNSSRRSLQFPCSFTQLSVDPRSCPLTSVTSFHLHKLLNRFQKLHSLSLSGCTQLQDSRLSILAHHGLNLQNLNLDCCFGINDHGISFIANGCPSLAIISLYRCNITDIGLQTLAKSCSALKDMNLSHCFLVTDHGIRAISQTCRFLRAIKISHCKNINGTGFQGCSETLRYIEAASCKLEPEGVSSIVSGGGIEYFDISNLSRCIHGHGLASINPSYIANLRVINFRLCRTIGNDVIIAMAKGCPLIEEWNLALCHEIQIAGWESIASNCHNLERLHVNRCRNLSDQGLLALLNGCERLQNLYLTRFRQVSLSAIEMFRDLRSDVEIVDEEKTRIAPDWAFRL